MRISPSGLYTVATVVTALTTSFTVGLATDAPVTASE